MSRMFKSITRTWNVFVGCRFDCTYCNARKLALGRLKDVDRYKDGFYPHPVASELSKTFKPGEFIFVGYMGDISFASELTIEIILGRIKKFPESSFLLCTKNPAIFAKWDEIIPPNVYLGTTIETNYSYPLSAAPVPYDRCVALMKYPHPNKFVSIEPIMNFTLSTMLDWMRFIKPTIIEVGADNYHNNLPEPSPQELEQLLTNLRNICPNVIEKDGLDRLKEGKEKGGNQNVRSN